MLKDKGGDTPPAHKASVATWERQWLPAAGVWLPLKVRRFTQKSGVDVVRRIVVVDGAVTDKGYMTLGCPW